MSIHLPVTLTIFFFFFFNDTATTEIYTLSLHDALPISMIVRPSFTTRPVMYSAARPLTIAGGDVISGAATCRDRKSTRLNSSHLVISYAVFCLKKKKKNETYVLKVTRKCKSVV